MKVKFLGTGTSQGVPVIACPCEVCHSADPRDNRLRTSILLEQNDFRVVIDTGPDFRQQMLRENVKSLHAVVFTHEHKDHIAGLDDVRAFNYFQDQPMDVYASSDVEAALRRDFHYVFENSNYPGIPKLNIHSIDSKEFPIGPFRFRPVHVWHYKMPVLAYRIGDFSYVTDANRIESAEKEKVKNSKVLVLNALRKEKHISHFNLEEALELIRELNPEIAYLTHISHQLGKHLDIEKELPENVFCAYDGLEINL